MSEVLSSSPESEGEFLFYTAADGAVKVEVFCQDETVWLTQKALAALFGVQVPAIAKHLKNIFESGELQRDATVSKMEIVQMESQRRVIREVEGGLGVIAKNSINGFHGLLVFRFLRQTTCRFFMSL